MVERVRRRRASLVPIGIGIAIFLVAALAIAIRMQRLPTGPEPIAWDREACAHCHMHVGDAHFAAQLQTTDGDVLNFDDPGCLFLYVRDRHPTVHAMYFHDVRQDRWWPRDPVGFVQAARTPMGYGLAAVDRHTANAIDVEAAERQVLARAAAGVTP